MLPRSFSALQRGAVGEVDGAAGAARRGALAGAPGEVLPRGVGAGHVRPLRARDRAADQRFRRLDRRPQDQKTWLTKTRKIHDHLYDSEGF